MIKRTRTAYLLAFFAALSAAPAGAADYQVAPKARSASYARPHNPYCSECCGCPVARLVRHRELRSGYASSYDPRVMTEPRYFYGSMRMYARFGRFADMDRIPQPTRN